MNKPQYTDEIARCISMRGLNIMLSRLAHGVTHNDILIYPNMGVIPTHQEPIPIYLN